MTFADKVKHVRIKLYLSQEALSNANRWENGRGKPNLVMKAKFNDYCEKYHIIFEEK